MTKDLKMIQTRAKRRDFTSWKAADCKQHLSKSFSASFVFYFSTEEQNQATITPIMLTEQRPAERC